MDEPTPAEGDRLRSTGDLAGALQIYRAVFARAESADVQRRIAETEDRLGHSGYAYSEYAKLVDRFGSQLTRGEQRRIEKRLKELDRSTGLLVLDPLPPAAVVRVDDQLVPGNLRSTPLRLARGERRIEVAIPNHVPVRLVVTIGEVPTRRTLTIEPLATTTSVGIAARDGIALDLYVDGTRIGPLPQRVQLTVGKHTLSANGETHFVPPQVLEVDTTTPKDLELPAIEKPAIVEIDPAAPDATLYLDERPIGTGARRLELTPGKHLLELRRTGYRVQRLTYDAKPGRVNVLRAAAYVPMRGLPNASVPGPAPTDRGSPAPTVSNSTKPSKPSHSTDHARGPASHAPDDEDAFRGLYGELFVPIMLGGQSTHSYVSSCPADAYGGTCSTTAPRGGGLALRLGYFYEWLGIEIFGAGAVDVSSAQLGLPPIASVTDDMRALAERTVFLRAGGLVGGGLRLSTPIKGIRVSLGADYLHVARKVIAIPDSFVGASLGYSAPGYFLDGGLELGSTPGTRFYLGAFLFIENAPDLVLNRDLTSLGITTTVPSELTTMTVYRGRQYLFGPLLGLTFGH
jgi:hypothetical protein